MRTDSGPAAAPAAGPVTDEAAAKPGTGELAPADVDAEADVRALVLPLTEARQKAVNTTLVEKGIAASRLTTCGPGIDDAPDARPRVEFGG